MARSKKSPKPVTDESSVNDNSTQFTGVVESGPDDGAVPESQTTEGTQMSDESDIPEGYTHTLNPVNTTPQNVAAEKAQAKIAAKAAKAEAAAAAKAEKEAAKLAKQTERETKQAEAKAVRESKTHVSEEVKAERAAAHAERLARIAALAEGRKYTASMLSLADRVKQGAYVKGTTGQLRSTDALAEALDAVPVMNVIALAKIVLGLDENPYSKLNTGQQSMNLRNKMRGAIAKGTLTIERVNEVIAAENFATAASWAADKAAKVAARAEAAATAKAAKEVKAAAAKAAKTEAEAVPA